jgi:hypothetical protein
MSPNAMNSQIYETTNNRPKNTNNSKWTTTIYRQWETAHKQQQKQSPNPNYKLGK